VIARYCLAFDASFGCLAWALTDGKRVLHRGWRRFPKAGRTFIGVRTFLDESILPVLPSPIDSVVAAIEEPEMHQKSMHGSNEIVNQCVGSVAMWCATYDLEPALVRVNTWRAHYKRMAGGAKTRADWLLAAPRIARALLPGSMDEVPDAVKPDVAMASLLAKYHLDAIIVAQRGKMG
jgi:hypothetical protein